MRVCGQIYQKEAGCVLVQLTEDSSSLNRDRPNAKNDIILKLKKPELSDGQITELYVGDKEVMLHCVFSVASCIIFTASKCLETLGNTVLLF